MDDVVCGVEIVNTLALLAFYGQGTLQVALSTYLRMANQVDDRRHIDGDLKINGME